MATQEGMSAKGIFGATASSGRAFNGKRFRTKTRPGALDRFATELSKHTDQDDIDAGRGIVLDPGGDVRACANAIGAKSQQGAAMLQRIRKRLGWQAS